MLTTERKNLSLSGGRLISSSDYSVSGNSYPSSYSPNGPQNGQQFPWEEDVNDINTPDIDPSFFTNGPFEKMSNNDMNNFSEDKLDLIINEGSFHNINDDTSQQTLDDNVFIDLSQLINQSTEESAIDSVTRESMVSPNDVLENTYIPSTTAPVFHYLQPNSVESIVPSVSIPVITTISTLIDSNSSHIHEESIALSETLTSSPHSSQSLSPPLMTSPSYITPSSPTLSYTSTTSNSYYVPSEEAMNTDSNTFDNETKPEVDFLRPTVINDHLYTLPSNCSSKRKSSTDSQKDHKYLTVRKKNNMASKKSRITKRDKQKLMDQQILHYIEDNQRCTEMIAKMEREIEWCKNYLFKKVISGSKS